MSDNPQNIDELVNRIQKLEKKQGNYRLGIAALLGLALLAVTPSVIDVAMAKPGDTLTAKTIALLDDDGTVRVLLSAGKTVDTGAQVSLFGKGGKPRTILATKGGPKLSLHDPSGQARVIVATRNNKEPLISIHDKKGGLMGSMTGLKDHGGHLMVKDREGNVRWQSAK
jgi:hypothetical protein